jgi:hypothetical protein
VRAIGEHPFLVVKQLWGHAKVRYRGIAKNLAQMYALFGLGNLHRPVESVGEVRPQSCETRASDDETAGSDDTKQRKRLARRSQQSLSPHSLRK